MQQRLPILLVVLLALSTLVSAQDVPRDQPNGKSQDRITREVRHELLMLPYFGVFDYIAFKVEGYNVTLLGQVVRPSLKSDAENAIKHIEGIEKVDHGLCVDLSGHDRVMVDRVMFATGRRPNIKGLGLEAVGIKLGRTGGIECTRRTAGIRAASRQRTKSSTSRRSMSPYSCSPSSSWLTPR